MTQYEELKFWKTMCITLFVDVSLMLALLILDNV